MSVSVCFVFFCFNDTATTEIYTLSLRDALPILFNAARKSRGSGAAISIFCPFGCRSEEHTSELQSRGLTSYAVFCFEKKQLLSFCVGVFSDLFWHYYEGTISVC